jgi:hypothetical protein
MRIIRYPLFDEPLTVGPAETLANDASRVGMQQHFPFSVFLFFFLCRERVRTDYCSRPDKEK